MYRRARLNYRSGITTRSPRQEVYRILRKLSLPLLMLASGAMAVYLAGSWLMTANGDVVQATVDPAATVARYDSCVRTEASQQQLLACVAELGNTSATARDATVVARQQDVHMNSDGRLVRFAAPPLTNFSAL